MEKKIAKNNKVSVRKMDVKSSIQRVAKHEEKRLDL